MANSGTQEGRVISIDANETESDHVGAENVSFSPQSTRVVLEQSLQQQNPEDPVLEEVPTQLEMFKQLRVMQSRLKSAEDALADCRRQLERRSGLKREADGPSGPFEKYKADPVKSKVDISDRYCWKCHSRHSGECSKATLRCSRCGELGHVVRDCINEVKCFNCKESGHLSTTCPKAKVALKRGNKKMRTRMT